MRSLQFLPIAANYCSSDVDDLFPSYDVIGVVSATISRNTMTSASLLNLFHVPMVAAFATSDEVRLLSPLLLTVSVFVLEWVLDAMHN